MNERVPTDAEAESTASVDGYIYTVKVVRDETGYRAHLSWLGRSTVQSTPPFSNPRAAMIEGHSLAEEQILAWRLNAAI